MQRFQSAGGLSASLGRRELLIGGAAMGLAACEKSMPMTTSKTPKLDLERLNREIAAIATRAQPAVLGVGLTNLESGEHFTYAGDRRFPMQSVFKALLGAAALAEVDAKRLALTEIVTLTDHQLSTPWSPIAAAWPTRRDYTMDELLVAAVADSDNTAADVLMKRIGGPGAVTAWLQGKGFNELRVDRYERELQPDVYGMASFRPAWRGAAAFDAARATVPPAQRRRAMLAYMADPRDTATPQGMLEFLTRLDARELLSPASTAKLLGAMSLATRGGERLRAGLPTDARFAHKTGTSGADQGLNAATNDVGIITLGDGRRYAVAAFLSGSTLEAAGRDRLLADVGRVVTASLGHGKA